MLMLLRVAMQFQSRLNSMGYEIASLRLAGPAMCFASGAYFWWVRGINRRVTQNALTRPTHSCHCECCEAISETFEFSGL